MAPPREFQWPAYVPVASRRERAAVRAATMREKGKAVDPVVITATGRALASSFWGAAWCRNLESYSDYENRLPRGRSYVRSGAVLDLKIASGSVASLVQGSRSSPYRISIRIRPLAKARWSEVVKACSGHIGSLVELLRGGFSDHVMRIVTEPERGLFPSPAEILLECSCPDWATMCKHVAASLYGVGARLDERPELLFTLRGVDPAELVASAAAGGALDARPVPRSRGLATANLSDIFGVEIDEAPVTKRIKRPRQDAPTVDPRSSQPNMANRRRTPARETEHPVSRLLLEFVRAEPGRRMEQIAVALGLTTRDLALDAKRLLATGHLRKVGERRATRYFPGSQATGNVEAKTRRRSPRVPSRSQGGRT